MSGIIFQNTTPTQYNILEEVQEVEVQEVEVHLVQCLQAVNTRVTAYNRVQCHLPAPHTFHLPAPHTSHLSEVTSP